MKLNLEGKRILVTGASRGIGAALAEALMAAGARVALHYNRSGEAAQGLAEKGGGGSKAFQADLADAEACRRLCQEVIAEFGGLDVLVNNAGRAEKVDFDAADGAWDGVWDRTMDVNLKAAGILSREAIRHFQTVGGGRIIHISSRAAFRGDTADYLAYGVSKAGMVALNGGIARGFGKMGVKSFLIAPGFVRTDMAQDFIEEYGEEYAMKGIALDRMTEPADLAGMVLLLASGLADHATGTSIDINAGSYIH